MAQSQKEVSYHIPHGWKYGYRAQICDSIMSGFEVMGYLVIWGRGSRHLGFKKMPPGEILHTLQKLSSQTLMNTYQSKKKLYTPFPPSASYGHISSWLLKECAKPLAPVIADFYQQSIDEARLPDDWKQQYVHPVFKKGSRSDPANYRPVALTCILCKTLEHIIASNLHCHLEEHGFLSDAQHGFRKLRSCETQLYATLQDFFDTLEAGGRLDAVILDFSKPLIKSPMSVSWASSSTAECKAAQEDGSVTGWSVVSNG